MSIDKKKIKAIIFDLDGVIIDSEPWQKKAFEKTLNPYGIKLTHEEFAPLIGIRTIENFIYLKIKYNLKGVPEELTRIKNQHYQQILENKIKPRKGLLPLLNQLFNRYILAVASGSIRQDVFQSLALLDLEKYFQSILTGDDIIKGKPDPEIFIKTSRRIKTHPTHCLVLEDSENGIKAAKQAGMLAVALPTPSTVTHDFSMADLILHDLNELKTIL
ncbi:MAG: HAD family phosphatase [Spirochaetes bacterium]|nr:HAD family phosphatase [Spirochaetota bacterium]